LIPLINTHTHRRPEAGEWCIRNAWLPTGLHFPETHGYWFSAGVHPWRAHRYPESQIKKRLPEILALPNCMAAGEMGLDRANGPDFGLQTRIWELQLNLVSDFKKPIIVHCVRAYSDFLPYAQKFKTQIFILHDYSGNPTQTDSLLKCANVFFSFGKSLLRNPEIGKRQLIQIPEDRILLETDTMNISLEAVYDIAAGFKGVNRPDFSQTLFANACRLFSFAQSSAE